jgi:hypothetical protein
MIFEMIVATFHLARFHEVTLQQLGNGNYCMKPILAYLLLFNP